METLAEFSARMAQVEQTGEPLIIGRACYGNTRSVFNFDGMECYLDSRGYRQFPKDRLAQRLPALAKAVWTLAVEPTDNWWTDYMIYGKELAQRVAQHYGATIQEAWYAKEDDAWFHLSFADDAKLFAFLFDRKTGAFDKQWQIANPAWVGCND